MIRALVEPCWAAMRWPSMFWMPLLGLPLDELFVLAPLAEDCARDRRYEFMVVSAPMVLEGGIATPPNAVVIK